MRHTLRLVETLLGFVRVWLVARIRAPRLSSRARARLGSTLARRTLMGLGVAVRIRGRLPRDAPCLLVANHVSWLDVQVLNAIRPARFVAKVETRAWPIVGGIARGFGAFFLRRGSCRDAARVKEAVARALAAGDTVAVFPEGTTTDGASLLRFRPALFQAAIDAGVLVHPIALRYRRRDGSPSRAAAFVGDMTFLRSLSNVLGEPGLVVEVAIGPGIPAAPRSRRALAAVAQATIASALALPPGAVQGPLPGRVARRPRRRAA